MKTVSKKENTKSINIFIDIVGDGELLLLVMMMMTVKNVAMKMMTVAALTQNVCFFVCGCVCSSVLQLFIFCNFKADLLAF